MDTATLIRKALDEESCGRLVRSGAVSQLRGGGMLLLTELARTFLPERYVRGTRQGNEEEWHERYRRAVRRLRAEGIPTASDPEAGARRYASLRREWDEYVAGSAVYMGYGWTEIAPHESATDHRQPRSIVSEVR